MTTNSDTELALRLFLLRLWACDTLEADDATGELYLRRSQPPHERFGVEIDQLPRVRRLAG